jgi:hypothetical protein
MTTFEHTGFWWDAREPGTRWPGTLQFDPVSGALLTRVIPNDPRLFFADAKEYEPLHGETTGGLRVTLLSAFEAVTARFTQTPSSSAFTPKPSSRRSLPPPPLSSSWANGGIRALSDDPALKHPDVSVQYRQPADVELHDDGVIRTTPRSAGLASYGPLEVSIREEIRIEMKASAPQPLSVFRARMHACRDLLSVAALMRCNLEELRFVPPY